MVPKDLYIDLGTTNTIVYARKQGLLLNEPTLVTAGGGHCTTGFSAHKMLGKTHEKLKVVKPLKEGVVCDFDQAKEMLSVFLKKSKNEMVWSRSRILISLPYLVSSDERMMFKELSYEMGAGIVQLISEPLAGAIGGGMDVFGNKPRMVMDLGGGTTEILILFKGRIIAASAERIGGNDIDTAVIENLKRNHQFMVGEQTAEWIKKQVGRLSLSSEKENSCVVGGLNLKTGLPEKRQIDVSMIREALLPTVEKIKNLVSKTFENCNPDLMSDIAGEGVMMFGGNSLIPGLPQYLTNHFSVPFYTSQTPLLSVSIGGARLLDDNSFCEKLLQVSEA